MRLRNSALSLAFLAVRAPAAACSKPEAPKPPAPAVSATAEGKALFEQKCSVCHGLDRATARATNKEEWAAIIISMQAKKADWIPEADPAKVLAYLSPENGRE